MDDDTSVVPLAAQTVRGPVGRALANDEAEVVDWQVTRLSGGFGFLAGLYRVTGHAHHRDALVSWSLILKIALPPPAGAGLPDGSALPDTANWQREFRIYESGLLQSLPPGLRAPQCHGAEDRGAYGLWLWLDDLGELDESPWSATRVGHVARSIGAFGGAFLGAQPIPAAPWLCPRWLRTWVGSSAMVPDIDVVGLLGHPHAARVLPAEHGARFTRLWQEREQFLTALDRLPLTFCHNDVHRRNLFVRRAVSGDEESVVIDWEDAGPGALGEDLAILVISRLQGGATARVDWEQIDAQAFAAYVEGLRVVGWHGDPRHVRFAYATRAALRQAALTRWLVQGLARGRLSPEFLARAFVCSPDEASARYAEVLVFLLDLADEARGLLPLL